MKTQLSRNKIALIGLGHHAIRIYLTILKELYIKKEIELVLVVEMFKQKERTQKLVLEAGFLKTEFLFIADEDENHCENIFHQLSRVHQKNSFQVMLISCDPLHRQAYFDFAIEKRCHVFVDKPIFAVTGMAWDPEIARTYFEQLQTLSHQVEEAKIDFVVQSQRRQHLGYQLVKNILADIVQKYRVPITSIHIQHADGMWVLPHEWNREHHPYKYGFGKLFHSGYHFVDLLCWLMELNVEFDIEQLDLAVKSVKPEDALHQWRRFPEGQWQNLPRELKTDLPISDYDLNALLDFRDSAHSVTVAHLQLQQNSFSDRDPQVIPTDLYKGTGRVRHERVDIKISTLLNIQIHSYQKNSQPQAQPDFQVGGYDHFDILIFRNTNIIGGKKFEKISISELADYTEKSHNEQSRERMLKLFLHAKPTQSQIADHLPAGRLISFLYEAVANSKGRMSVLQKSFYSPK